MTSKAIPATDARSIHHTEPASPPHGPSELEKLAAALPTDGNWLSREELWTLIDDALQTDGPDHHGRAVDDRARAITATTALFQAGPIEISRGADHEEIYRRPLAA